MSTGDEPTEDGSTQENELHAVPPEGVKPGRGSQARLCTTSIEFEIPFHDVDALQIVWHGHYYKYYELARTELMRSCELDVSDLVELGHRMLVIESRCRHIAPLAYRDRARVTAWFADITHRLNVRYEIENLTTGRRAARGQTVLVATTREGTMLHRTPESIVQKLLGHESARSTKQRSNVEKPKKC